MRRPGLIILAAGASSRMGQPKQLLPWKGRTLLRRAAETALPSDCFPIVIVLGSSADLCRKELQGLPVTIVENSHWREGMGTSVAAGTKALLRLEPESPAVLFLLVDQPSLTSSYLELLLSEWERRPESIIATRYGDVGGTPAIFPQAHFDELQRCQGDHGARRIIHRLGAKLLNSDQPLFDLDTPESYAEASRCFAE
jgi:molybdenum cofactor cytidylyltransferase